MKLPFPVPNNPSRLFSKKTLRRILGYERSVSETPHALLIQLRKKAEEDQEFLNFLQQRLLEGTGCLFAGYVKELDRLVVFRGGANDLEREHAVAVVDQAEEQFGWHSTPFAKETNYPGDSGRRLRLLLEMVLDIGGFTGGLFMSRINNRTFQLFTDVSAASTAIENSPTLRNALEHWLGSPVDTDILLRLANVVSDSFSQGGTGSLVDLAHRIQCWQADVGQERCWKSIQDQCLELIAESYDPSSAIANRPTPVPQGLLQKYDDTSEKWSLASFSSGMAFTHNLTQSASTLFSSIPKPAHLGVGSFSMTLIAALAEANIQVLDADRLSLLDRIDRIVIDERLFTPEHELIISHYPIADRPPSLAVVDRLLHHETTLEHGEHYCRLSVETESSMPTNVRRWWKATGQPVSSVRLIKRDDTVVSAVLVGKVHDRTIESVLAHIHRSELKATLIAPGQTGLIREYQSHGETVMAIGGAALIQGADIAVGLLEPTKDWPTHCHILGRDAVDTLWRMTSAVTLARTAIDQSVELAKIDAFTGLILSLGKLERRMLRRIRFANNLANICGIANGYRLARKVGGIPEDFRHDFIPWHAMDVEIVRNRLDRQREAAPVPNTTPTEPPALLPARTFGKLWMEELASPLMPALVTGTGLAALTGAVGDALLIASVIALNGLVGGSQRYHTQKELSALMQTTEIIYPVTRGSELLKVKAAELQPGDEIQLGAGDVVPADARLLEAISLEVDESSLTGESLPVKKQVAASFSPTLTERTSMLFEGTAIAQGTARGIVVTPQHLSEARRNHSLDKTPETGVEARLNHLTEMTIPIAAFSGIALLLSGLSRDRPVKEVIGSGISLAVAAVPEGLPIMATLAQLSSTRRLSEKGALARNPRAIEALGRMDVLCADKTGTLTEGRLALRSIAVNGEIIAIESLNEMAMEVLMTGLFASPEGTLDHQATHLTDRALGDAAARYSHQLADRISEWQRVRDMPFKSERNYHAALFRSGNRKTLCVKGAPETVLKKCNRHQLGIGKPQPLSEENLNRLTAEANALARRGFRVLAVARRPARSLTLNRDKVTRLIFLGFIVLSDPVRPSAKQAVSDLREAGIRVTMITGDHPLTAAAIAEELEIDGEDKVLTGAEIEDLTDDQLKDEVGSINVFARVTPAQKARIVRAFQANGHVVGMTGDGANDAAALRLAEVGIALGAHASVAAQQSADLQVIDSRIETIGIAVLEGRALWTAVRDAVSLLVGGNLGEIGFSLIAGLFIGQAPLNARQLLLINLLTDTVPALAVALRKPTGLKTTQLLGEGPEASLGDSLTREIQWRAGLTTGITTATWAGARLLLSPERASTVAMLTLISSQMGQILVAGKGEKKVTGSSLASLAALTAAVEVPVLNRFFGCRRPGILGWSMVGASLGASVAASILLPRLDNLTSKWGEKTATTLHEWLEEKEGSKRQKAVRADT